MPIFQHEQVWLIFEAQQIEPLIKASPFIKACPCRGALVVAGVMTAVMPQIGHSSAAAS
jgi:hypothetical protein